METKTDSIYVTKHDTVIKTAYEWLHDSVFVHESNNTYTALGVADVSGYRVDTVYREKVRIEYRERSNAKTDTEKVSTATDSTKVQVVYKDRKVVEEVERKFHWYEIMFILLGIGSLVLLALWLFIFVYTKFKK